jgi:hypothetical protein
LYEGEDSLAKNKLFTGQVEYWVQKLPFAPFKIKICIIEDKFNTLSSIVDMSKLEGDTLTLKSVHGQSLLDRESIDKFKTEEETNCFLDR